MVARGGRLRLRAKNEGVPYKAESHLNSYQAVRSGLWKELPLEERQEWEAKGKKKSNENRLVPSNDLYVLMYIFLLLLILAKVCLLID